MPPADLPHRQSPDAVRVVITCDDAFTADSALQKRVVTELESKGLAEVRVLDRLGIVTGRIAASRMTALSAVPHVVGVERDQPRSAI